jgi:hypothetical protein
MGISSDTQHELGVLFGEILCADVNVLDLASAGRLMGGCQRVRSVNAVREAEITAVYERLLRESQRTAFDEADEGSPGEPDPDPEPVRPRVPPAPRESAKERQRRLLRAKWLGFCQRFADALAAGTITVEHADVLAQILDRTEPPVVNEVLTDEAALVLKAQVCTSEQFSVRLLDAIALVRADGGARDFERQQAESRAWTKFDPITGTYFFGIVLDPERAPILDNAIRQRMNALYATPGATTGMTEAKVRLQAILDLVCGTATVIPEAIVLTDERTVREGPHPGTIAENIDGIRLPVDRVINCCASGKVTTAILNANGRVVESATCDRVATKEQRKLLRAMYRTCAHPDCSVPFSACQIHHVEHWENHGPTEIANLLPLCFEHHHLVHEGGWALAIDPERTLTWTAPDGTTRVTPLESLLHQPTLRAVNQADPDIAATSGAPPERGPPTAAAGTADDDAQPQLFDPHAA